MVLQTALSLKHGVALAIILLALASDQESKIKSTAQDGGPLSYHLDEYLQPSIMNTISDQLLQMRHGTYTCMYLFASLQHLLHGGSPWLELMVHLCNQQLLSLLCIDEAHLFLKFGQSFHQEFRLLKDRLFSHLHPNSQQAYLRCPVLIVMTATLTHQMLVK